MFNWDTFKLASVGLPLVFENLVLIFCHCTKADDPAWQNENTDNSSAGECFCFWKVAT